LADFFQLAETINTPIDLVFLSPPWGGINYNNCKQSDLSELPLDVFQLYLYCLRRLDCKNIVLFLPRNSNIEQIIYMAGPGGHVEIEQNFLNNKLVGLTAYYGKELATK
jgi:trimethylguanosine synthase